MSKPLLAAEEARARRTAETQRAAEITVRYPGWTVWAAREGNARVATRSGNQRPPKPDDGLFAATLICDDWTELEHKLAEQAQYDAERTYL